MRKLLQVAVLLLCSTCADLPDIDRNVCGNGVIDKGEQCDGIGVDGVPCYAQGQAACHLDCSATDHTCPAGYACGADNVCRRGDGRFSKKSIDVSADVQRLASGDFDGDRREDVVAIGTATTRVRFFDGDGNISGEPIVLSTGAGGTAVGSLSDDGLSGLVLSSSALRPDPGNPQKVQLLGGDLNVLLGSDTRTLLPSIYPNVSVEATDLRLAVVKGANGATLFTLARAQDKNVLVSANNLLFPLDNLPKSYGKPGRIPQVKYPCESVVLPLGDKVHVYAACKGPPAKPVLNTLKGFDNVTQVPAQTVQLEDGAPTHLVQAAGSAFGIFADADVIPNLLVAGNGIAYLAYGVPDGTFNSTSPVPASGGDNVALPYGDFSAGLGAQVGRPGAPVTPLAVGDFDGDALLDWVDGAGIHGGKAQAPRLSPNGATRWLDAYIGDANGNGAKDIIAVSEAGIDFYNGNGQGEFNLLSVPFDGTPTKLTLGDFDGDFIPDAAVTASGGVGGDQGDALYVLFGKASGFPEPPQLVGRLPGVQQLAAVGAFSVGTVDELIALTTRADGRIDASGLVADATRQFSAPFNLTTALPGATLDGFPAQNLVGHFEGSHQWAGEPRHRLRRAGAEARRDRRPGHRPPMVRPRDREGRAATRVHRRFPEHERPGAAHASRGARPQRGHAAQRERHRRGRGRRPQRNREPRQAAGGAHSRRRLGRQSREGVPRVPPGQGRRATPGLRRAPDHRRLRWRRPRRSRAAGPRRRREAEGVPAAEQGRGPRRARRAARAEGPRRHRRGPRDAQRPLVARDGHEERRVPRRARRPRRPGDSFASVRARRHDDDGPDRRGHQRRRRRRSRGGAWRLLRDPPRPRGDPMRRLGPMLLAVAMLAASAPARADTNPVQQAKALFSAGASAYDKGDYVAAIQAFEGAAKLAPRPALVFSLAQAHRRQYYIDSKAEHLRAAVDLYRAYLEQAPEGNRRADASQALQELGPAAQKLGGDHEATKVQEPARISIHSSGTPGARVSLDGGKTVEAPLIGPVPAGKHTVVISAEGFFDETREVTAVDGTIIAEDVALRERPALVTLLRADDGARVEVDGRFVSTTPLHAPLEIAPGSHLLTVTKNGHEAFARDLDLGRGETRTLDAKLAPSKQRSVAAWLFGAGGVAVVAGGAFLTVAMVEEGNASSILDSRATRNLTAADLDRYDAARRARTSWTVASVAGFASGAVLAATALVLYLFDPPSTPSAARRDDAPKPAGAPQRRVEPAEVGLGFTPWLAPNFIGGGAEVRF